MHECVCVCVRFYYIPLTLSIPQDAQAPIYLFSLLRQGPIKYKVASWSSCLSLPSVVISPYPDTYVSFLLGIEEM